MSPKSNKKLSWRERLFHTVPSSFVLHCRSGNQDVKSGCLTPLSYRFCMAKFVKPKVFEKRGALQPSVHRSLGKWKAQNSWLVNFIPKSHLPLIGTEKRSRKPENGIKDSSEEIEHEFQFGTFRPGKEDYDGCSRKLSIGTEPNLLPDKNFSPETQKLEV